jgi:5-methylcytosine-specific restriction enzyme A
MRLRNPFYDSPEWKLLRWEALDRDHHRCVTPGCGRRATRVDHILSRGRGGPDALSNLRCLCAICDNKIKEDRDGNRRSAGRLSVIGIDGWPISN